MTYAYVVIVSGVATAKVLKEVMDHSRFFRSKLEATFVCFPNTLLVATELTAPELSTLLRRRFHASIRHILVLDAATDRGGWLPKSAWDFLKNYDPALEESDVYEVQDEDEDEDD